MQGKNRCFSRLHPSKAKFRVIIRSFALDFPALKDASSPFSSKVEVDESYFGTRRVRGKKGRGAGAKMIVFGILRRQGKVYTEIVQDASKKQLQAAIRG